MDTYFYGVPKWRNFAQSGHSDRQIGRLNSSQEQLLLVQLKVFLLAPLAIPVNTLRQQIMSLESFLRQFYRQSQISFCNTCFLYYLLIIYQYLACFTNTNTKLSQFKIKLLPTQAFLGLKMTKPQRLSLQNCFS